MDICSDHLLDVFKREKFDMVIHLAAQTLVPVSLEKVFRASKCIGLCKC
jgi:nucleoside-diphosphate-sugar epimerase